ncbi:MAG: hypothetical protein HKN47_13395 [Pirellulaceae bacterium]|nr:hypothetical protein [Pirellulaceae bacterium]
MTQHSIPSLPVAGVLTVGLPQLFSQSESPAVGKADDADTAGDAGTKTGNPLS